MNAPKELASPIEALQVLYETECIAAIDYHFARVVEGLSPGESPWVYVAAALASRAVQAGHVCLDLPTFLSKPLIGSGDEPVAIQFPSLEQWQKHLGKSALVSKVHFRQTSEATGSAQQDEPDPGDGGLRPLQFEAGQRLYLHRYANYQQRLVQALVPRIHETLPVDEQALATALDGLFDPVDAQPAESETAPSKSEPAESAPSESEPSESKSSNPPDYQRAAAAVALRHRFCVISGGPGTGKTTTVAKILLLIQTQALQTKQRPARVLLLAPTGKAAQRLSESIESSLNSTSMVARLEALNPETLSEVLASVPRQAATIHRALGFRSNTPTRFFHNAERPLQADVVLVDEASMVDLALMTKLVEAVPQEARLILLGDKDQLASVEAGAILGDVFNADLSHDYSPAQQDFLKRVADPRVTGVADPSRLASLPTSSDPAQSANQPSQTKQSSALSAVSKLSASAEPSLGADQSGAGMADCMVQLVRSYRYDSGSPIGKLARAIRRGDPVEALRSLSSEARSSEARSSETRSSETAGIQAATSEWIDTEGFAESELDAQLLKLLTEGFADYVAADSPEQRLHALTGFRLLTPHRRGAIGAVRLNRLAEAVLRPLLGQPHRAEFYAGRPIIVTENDYQMELFNGDIGVVDFNDDRSRLVAYFDGPGGLRQLQTSRLPAHESVFAMTVHKSQGSEFEHVALVLPAQRSPIVTRELLYTGVTRARRGVRLLASRQVVSDGLSTRIQRASGLRDALWA